MKPIPFTKFDHYRFEGTRTIIIDDSIELLGCLKL